MQVDVEGLEAWSAQCGTTAGQLAADTTTASDLPSGQATATAVSAGQTLIGGTASVMAARVESTAATASAAAAAYADQDAESAQRLAAVSPGPVAG